VGITEFSENRTSQSSRIVFIVKLWVKLIYLLHV